MKPIKRVNGKDEVRHWGEDSQKFLVKIVKWVLSFNISLVKCTSFANFRFESFSQEIKGNVLQSQKVELNE